MNDLLLNNDGDLDIQGGDFSVGETTLQNQSLILAAHQGEFKQYPTIGVGIQDLLLSYELLEFRHKIRNHFAMDGLKIKHLELYEIGNLKITASYE